MSGRRWILIGLAMAFGLIPEAMIGHALLAANGLPIALFKRDFLDFWSAAWLIEHGRIAVMFHPALFQAWLHHRFSFVHGRRLWSYPPSMGLLMAPLCLFPPLAAWCVWLLGGIAAIITALRAALGRQPIVLLAALISALPVFWDNLLVGQNASYTGALIIAGFGLMDRRPVWAGIAFGLLTAKPQLGLLVPVALVAAKAWRSIAAAAVTALALAALAAWAMPGSWSLFFAHVAPAMKAQLLRPYVPTPTQAYMASAFVTAEGLGLPRAAAWIIQGTVTLAAATALWMLWRQPAADPAARRTRMLASAALGLAATPYTLDYDAVGATALLCGVLVHDGAALPRRKFALTLIALAQPGWSLILGIGLHTPVFPWIIWLLLGFGGRTLGIPLSGSNIRAQFLAGVFRGQSSLSLSCLKPIRAQAGGPHIEREAVRERREGA